MRKIWFCLLISLITCVFAKAQYVNIADSNFRALLIKVYPACFDGSGQMDTTCRGIITEDSLYVNQDSIQDLSGIQYFKSLKLLDCENNQLTTLPTLPNSLQYLYCSNNQLASLPDLPKQLLSFNCENNQLTTLPSLPASLTRILCDENGLQNLPTLPDSLNTLVCSFNQLTALPTLPANLTLLDCGNNQLATLPTLPSSLQNFYCYGNRLTSLPTLSKNISLLDCGENIISQIPTLPYTLYSLDCDSNQLTALPYNLPTTLNYLDVSINPVSSIPFLDSLYQLQYLYCQGDSNLLCLPRLPNTLDSLNVSGTGVRCIPNTAGNTNVYPAGLSICNPTNNANHCNAFPVITGKVFYDKNSNGIKDTDEFYIPYVPVTLNQGQTSFTNDAGQFIITTTDTGSFTLNPIVPRFFKAVPNGISFSFSSYEEQLALQDIAIQPNGLKDSLAIHIYPWQNAIPGRAFAYSISYRNLGTNDSYDTVRFTYDSSKLVFDSASITILSNIGNTITWLDTLSANYFGNEYYRSGYKYPYFLFSVKPNTERGLSLFSTATISNVSTRDSSTIKGSYDPNCKKATPKLTTTQVVDGDGIDYKIDFQNVGNASARDVVIADTLNTLLDKNLFQMIGSSHSPNIEINNTKGIVYFKFFDIDLDDSSSSQTKSNGFVNFKLTPLPGDTIGSNIFNKASIYFDYNNPVVTNTTNTIIISDPLPVTLSDYQLKEIVGNIISVKNNWSTANELNTAYFNVQRSINGVDYATIGKINAKGRGANNYQFIDNTPANGINYYRLQIIDRNGNLSYSKVVAIQLSAIANRVSVYPNPAKNFIIVNGKNIKQTNIIDNLGRTVATKKGMNAIAIQNKIEFKLSSGIYTAQILMADGETVIKKIVVE